MLHDKNEKKQKLGCEVSYCLEKLMVHFIHFTSGTTTIPEALTFWHLIKGKYLDKQNNYSNAVFKNLLLSTARISCLSRPLKMSLIGVATEPTHLLKWSRQFLTDFLSVQPIRTSNGISIIVLTSQKKGDKKYVYKEKKGDTMLRLTLRHTDQLSHVPHPWCHKAVLETQVAWGKKNTEHVVKDTLTCQRTGVAAGGWIRDSRLARRDLNALRYE